MWRSSLSIVFSLSLCMAWSMRPAHRRMAARSRCCCRRCRRGRPGLPAMAHSRDEACSLPAAYLLPALPLQGGVGAQSLGVLTAADEEGGSRQQVAAGVNGAVPGHCRHADQVGALCRRQGGGTHSGSGRTHSTPRAGGASPASRDPCGGAGPTSSGRAAARAAARAATAGKQQERGRGPTSSGRAAARAAVAGQQRQGSSRGRAAEGARGTALACR